MPSDLKADMQIVLRAFDLGIFVRDVTADSDPDWAMRIAPYIAALARLKEWADAE
jgi:hypothetical protein